MNHLLICKKCSEVILKSMGGESKIRSKVIVVRDDKVYAVCKGCDSEVQIPLSFNQNALNTRNPALILGK